MTTNLAGGPIPPVNLVSHETDRAPAAELPAQRFVHQPTETQ